MSSPASHDYLVGTRDLLHAAKLIWAWRPFVAEREDAYIECVDSALSQLLELVSAFMESYALGQAEIDEMTSAEEVGEEPRSYADACRMLAWFIDEVRKEVDGAIASGGVLLRAYEINVRARTYSSCLAEGSENGAIH
jgi:hypothetical protein